MNSKRQGAPVPPALDEFFAQGARRGEGRPLPERGRSSSTRCWTRWRTCRRRSWTRTPRAAPPAPSVARAAAAVRVRAAPAVARVRAASWAPAAARPSAPAGHGRQRTLRVTRGHGPAPGHHAGGLRRPRPVRLQHGQPPLSPANRARPPRGPRGARRSAAAPGMSVGKKVALIAVPLVLIGAGVAVVMSRGGGRPTHPAPRGDDASEAGRRASARACRTRRPTVPRPGGPAAGRDGGVRLTPRRGHLRRGRPDWHHAHEADAAARRRRRCSLQARRPPGRGAHAQLQPERGHDGPARGSAPGAGARRPSRPSKPAKPSNNGSDPGIGVFE